MARFVAASACFVVPLRAAGAQATRVIAGTITDSRFQPLDGVIVRVSGTTTATRSDSRGSFRLANVAGDEVSIEATMIGFRPLAQRVRVGTENLRLVMVEAAVQLNELVVTGTVEAQQRRSVGNTVATVSASELQEIAPARDITSVLNGRAPGISVVQGTGTVGGGPRVTIRGQGSLSLSDQPLLY